MHGVLAWLDFLIKELNIPITIIKDCLDSVEHIRVENLTPEERNSLKIIRENISKLTRVMEGLGYLNRAEWLMAGVVFGEVNLGNTLDWIMEQVKELAEQRKIEADIEGVEDISPLLIARRDLNQGLLYIVRGEIQSSPAESRLHIQVAERNTEFINN